MGRSTDPLVLTGEAYDEVEMLKANLERKNRISVFFIYFHKTILFNYFGKYREANAQAYLARPLLDAVLAKLEVAYHHFHEALAAIGCLKQPGMNTGKLQKRVRKNMGKMRTWAKHAPENFLHKYELLQAQLARVEARHEEAQSFFELAIKHAEQHAYIHEQALAYELAGEYYRERGNANLSTFYLRNAYQSYREWGAAAKMEDLQNKYPEVISSVVRKGRDRVPSGDTTFASATTTIDQGVTLDLDTVLKASASISGEIVIDKLIDNLMHILMENLGATRGVLMLEQDGQLFIEAQAGTTGMTVDRMPALGSGILPESIIVFVRRTLHQVVLQNAVTDSKYHKDPFIQAQKPLSLLCYPILHKGSLTGIVYFENNLAEAAFTGERLELLSLLSGQIAISIENALLYENLEQKVEDRTAELNAEKKKSDALLLNILPETAAEELKQYGKTTPQRFEEVSVLFTDFVDFTRISSGMNPTALVDELGMYFAEFDRIIDKYGLEKIKTIGDSYMCAGGLPKPDEDHALKTVGAAIEIRDFMARVRDEKTKAGKPHFGIRIGIHSGPVVAGVVGLKKFAYDIWGDTVNTASRIEMHCEPWQVNISGGTLAYLNGKVDYTHRGRIQAKSMGEIDMYYVNSIHQ
jgi:class 3 adenylate cyclase